MSTRWERKSWLRRIEKGGAICYNLYTMKNAIWRSRAIAILGFFTLFIIIFPGLPTGWVLYLCAVMGFFVMVLGFIGSRTHAYKKETLPRPAVETVEAAPKVEEAKEEAIQ